MASAAQQDGLQEELTTEFTLQATGTEGAAALRQTVAERLALHRSRRAGQARQEAQQAAQREEVRAAARQGTSRVREAVTARYQNSVSYREYLAAEAERALQQAQAEAEIAARNARAVAEAQIQLLQEIEQWNQPEPGPREQALEQVRTETRGELAHALADIALGARELMREPDAATRLEVPAPLSMAGLSIASPSIVGSAESAALALSKPAKPLTEVSSGGLTVKLYDGLETAAPALADLKLDRKRTSDRFGMPEEIDALDALEQEITLRHAAEIVAPHTLETTPIPANLIEFPRQLIAPRKARPRLAEGPLREEAPTEPQLRIFEVEPEQIETMPEAVEPAGAPGWQELYLESATVPAHVPPAEAQVQFTLPPQIAPMRKRLWASTVDGACLLAALGCFLELAFHLGGEGLKHAPLPLLGAAVGGALLLFYTLYQMLFFTFTDATPGMRAARIALCTFGDDNPSRQAMRRRVFATLLAACPLGLGLLWSFLDDETLGWHDRMSRMYQRAY